ESTAVAATLDELGRWLNRLADGRRGPVLPDVVPLLQQCRAEQHRGGGTDQLQEWETVAAAWAALEWTYPVADARWREAEAEIGIDRRGGDPGRVGALAEPPGRRPARTCPA